MDDKILFLEALDGKINTRNCVHVFEGRPSVELFGYLFLNVLECEHEFFFLPVFSRSGKKEKLKPLKCCRTENNRFPTVEFGVKQ